ncbi:rhombosortase [Gynuella sunshinyii]|uniref:Putative membrane protein n=1 Tax=Gynuella sunshinyii YC6258 TaxID=1445510 RepID=A0A0C5V687_9GAMM|nr:rhombosortase [Gynuella sunshinyii]AJQ94980.1 putative membrane protein [Gynuella sunshinyii YC6258]
MGNTIFEFLWQRWFLVILFVLITAVAAAPESVQMMLSFQRDAIDNGQLWRLLTCHLVHLNWQHWMLNLFGFSIVFYVCPPWLGQWQGVLVFCFLALVVGLGIYWFDAQLWGYTGLSGVLYGLLCLALIFSPFYSLTIRYIAVLAVTGKIIWEQTPFYSDSMIAGFIHARVAQDAHLYGLLGFVAIYGSYVFARLLSSSVKNA